MCTQRGKKGSRAAVVTQVEEALRMVAAVIRVVEEADGGL